jgi:hypothetical protein
MIFITTFWILCFFYAAAAIKATANTKYQYFIFGDSMVNTGFGNAVKKKLPYGAKNNTRTLGKSSSGLSRPDLFDWQKAAARELTQAQPNAEIFVMIGTNDCQDITTDSGTLSYDSDQWKDAYKSRLLLFAGTLCQSAKQVYWVGLPPMRSKKFDDKITKLNLLTSGTLASVPCVQYFPTTNILGTQDGSYIPTLQIGHKKRTIRESDGIHITYHGALYLAEKIFDTFKQ